MIANKPVIKHEGGQLLDKQMFRRFFDEHAAIMLLIETQSGDILDANLAAVNFYGYPKSKLCSMSINDIATYPPEQTRTARQKAYSLEQNHFIYPHRLASGEERLVEEYSSPLDFDEKQALFSIIHDITRRKPTEAVLQQAPGALGERAEELTRVNLELRTEIAEHRQAEAALRESEEKFRNIVEHATDGITLVDEEGNIVEWNPAQAQMTGVSHAEVKGKPLWDVQFHNMRAEHRLPEAYEQIKTFVQRMVTSGEVPKHIREQEVVIQDSNGSERVVRSVVYSIKTSRGFQLASISRDITERKRIEDTLKESEARYRAVMQSANDAIITADSSGNVAGWNRGAETIFGYSEAEIIGKPLTVLMPSNFQAGHIKSLANAQTGGEKHIIGKTIEVEGHRKDGSEFPLEISLAEWQVDSNRFFTSIIRDITERKQVELELRQAKETLEATHNELERAFAREQKLARTDYLTGVNNRRHLFELAERAFEVAIRYKQPFTVMSIDIDHFKKINDTYGHDTGDRVLQKVAQVFFTETRSADGIGRYGGEEFVIILPMTNAQHTFPLAERIRKAVSAISLPTSQGNASVTLSIGLAEINLAPQDKSVESVITRADKALYAAKQTGRNRTEIFNPD